MTTARARHILTAAMAVTTLACSPSDQAKPAEARVDPPAVSRSQEARPMSPASGRRNDLPRATAPDGTVLDLELALTPEERVQGLMFRPSLADNRGMLFVFPDDDRHSFWMMNTWIALDIVFLDGQGVVTQVIENARPCPSEPCPRYVSDGPVRAALEVNAGRAAELGLTVGARIEVANVPGYPALTPAH